MKYNGVVIDRLSVYGFKIRFEDNDEQKVIYINPSKIRPEEDADVVLLTMPILPFFSIYDVKKIINDDSTVFAPLESAAKFKQGLTAEPGNTHNLGYVDIDVVPAYNIHPMNDRKMLHYPEYYKYCGYLIKIGDIKIYYTGKSNFTKEMEKIECDVLIPIVNNRDTMDTEEVLDVIDKLKPNLVLPIFDNEPEEAEDLVDISPVETRDLKY